MVGGRNGSDSQVRKSRAMAFAACAIGQPAGNSCAGRAKRQAATAVEMQHRRQALVAANALCRPWHGHLPQDVRVSCRMTEAGWNEELAWRSEVELVELVLETRTSWGRC